MFIKRYFNMMFERKNFHYLLHAIMEETKDFIVVLLNLIFNILMLVLYPFIMLIWTINEK